MVEGSVEFEVMEGEVFVLAVSLEEIDLREKEVAELLRGKVWVLGAAFFAREARVGSGFDLVLSAEV